MVAGTVMRKVLVIDDERGPRESLRILLKNDYTVACAESVDKGLELLKDSPPDLVILDIRMPGKSGIEGLEEIRKIDPHVSVVMLTGFGALETAQQALRMGATDYMNKPFDTNEMRETVRRYTHRSELERKRARMLLDLEDMNKRLVGEIADHQHMAKMGQSSAEFVHDLRNPLTIVSGYVSLLSDEIKKSQSVKGQEGKQASDYLDVIERNVHRCCELSNMWQKMGKSGLNEFGPTPILRVMDDLRSGVEPLASTAQVQIEFAIDPAGGTIQGSRAQLIRAIHNVIANGIDAVPAKTGRVMVVTRRAAEAVEIHVEDNGCGMPLEVLNRIFDPYFTTKGEERGTGLGMTITRKIIEEHKGTLSVESQPGRGTTVSIRLPLVAADSVRPSVVAA